MYKLADAFIEIGANWTKADQAIGQLKSGIAGKVGGAVNALKVQMGAAGAAITGGLGLMAKGAADFGKLMANVATLGVKDLDSLDEGVRNVATRYGIDLNEAAQVLYDTISAGIPEDSAILTLEKAAIGAQAGVGSLASAMDIGTSVMNAFGLKTGDTATDVASFEKIMGQAATAVKDGKTTFDQLSTSIGQVAPVMSQAGVSTDEFFAAVSALTATGQPTSSAMMALRQGVSNILKPTGEAKELAAELGLEFNATALESKGLAGFLQDVADKTGGSVDKMSVLFGSVEALGPMLALTGSQSESFAKTLESMGNAQQNVNEMAAAFRENNPAVEYAKAKAELQNMSIVLGRAVLPAMTALVMAIKPVIVGVASMVEAFPRLSAVGMGTVLALGFLLTGLSTLGFAATGLSGILTALGVSIGGLGAAATAAATGGAVAGAAGAGAAGAGAAGAGAAAAGGAGAAAAIGGGFAGLAAAMGTAALSAVAVAGALALVAPLVFEVTNRTQQLIQEKQNLAESNKKIEEMDKEYVRSLIMQGATLDAELMKTMDRDEKLKYLAERKHVARMQQIRDELEALKGRGVTAEEVDRAEMARLIANVDVATAAALAHKGISEERLREIGQLSGAEQERLIKSTLGIQEEAQVHEQQQQRITRVHREAQQSQMDQLLQNLSAMSASRETTLQGWEQREALFQKFVQAARDGDTEHAGQFWEQLATLQARGLAKNEEQFKAFAERIKAEAQAVEDAIAKALNPDQHGSPSLNELVQQGYRNSLRIVGDATKALKASFGGLNQYTQQSMLGAVQGQPSGLLGESAAASPAISVPVTITGNTFPVGDEQQGAEFVRKLADQVQERVVRGVQNAMRAQGQRAVLTAQQ